MQEWTKSACWRTSVCAWPSKTKHSKWLKAAETLSHDLTFDSKKNSCQLKLYEKVRVLLSPVLAHTHKQNHVPRADTNTLVRFVTISLCTDGPALMDGHSLCAKQISSITTGQTACRGERDRYAERGRTKGSR